MNDWIKYRLIPAHHWCPGKSGFTVKLVIRCFQVAVCHNDGEISKIISKSLHKNEGLNHISTQPVRENQK